MKILHLSLSFIIVFFTVHSFAQIPAVKQIELKKFNLQSSAVIEDTGEIISKPDYHSSVYWFPVKVPSTVLSGLVANKVYPDPYFGMNNMLIPDASDEFNKQYNLEQYSHLPNDPNPWKKPYWYRTTFNIPSSEAGKNFQLIFKGINYRAAVWLNGHQIADSTEMAGMFAEYKLNVTSQILPGKENDLAVKIYPLDYPGLPAAEQLEALGDFYANGGPTGDIGKNVTMLCSVGWDWIPPVRDRNIGIWQPVYLRNTGPVTIEKLQIITDLPDLPDTSTASLSLSLALRNHSETIQDGELRFKIFPENFNGEPIEFTWKFSVEPHTGSRIQLNGKDTEALNIKDPRLWWPNGYGSPNLYRLTIDCMTGAVVSDESSTAFGIRSVSSKAIEVKGKSLRRDFYVNGRRVHLVGGAWVPDMMLNRDSARWADELQLCRNANVNLVRIWGGGITPPDVFFDLADRYGLLVWSDFWVTGDTQGEFKGSPDWPLESSVFIKNMTSTIYRIRNHPSLLVWTGGNEGHARKELYDAMRDSIISLDGTRPFIPSSSGFARLPKEWKGSWPDNKAPGVYSGGPYTWNPPEFYFELVNNRRDWAFKDETGLPSQPPYNTLQKIIPDLVWDKSLPFPFNDTWGYHDAATGNGRYDRYYEDMIKRYGEPESMQDFSEKMQLMNAEAYRAIFEAAGHKLNETGGVMLWKLNAAFPSVVWQIYDWFLQPNAGYYFMQNACEPVHIQFNYDDSTVAVVNRSYHPVDGLSMNAEGYDLSGKVLFSKTAAVNISNEEVKEILPLASDITASSGISFLQLEMTDESGKTVSQNTYWFSSSDNFQNLSEMPVSDVKTKVVASVVNGTDHLWTLKFTNDSEVLAFFIRPQIMINKEEIQPAFWSASYFTLSPSESMNVIVKVPDRLLGGEMPCLQISGWNMKTRIMPLKD